MLCSGGISPAFPGLSKCTRRSNKRLQQIANRMRILDCSLTAAAFAMAATQTLSAQDKPAAPEKPVPTAEPAKTDAISSFLNGKLPDALAKGKFSLNVRPRWEHAHQTGLRESDA